MIIAIFLCLDSSSPASSRDGITSPVSFREERALHYAIARIAEMEHREELIKSPPHSKLPSPVEKDQLDEGKPTAEKQLKSELRKNENKSKRKHDITESEASGGKKVKQNESRVGIFTGSNFRDSVKSLSGIQTYFWLHGVNLFLIVTPATWFGT